MKKLEPSISSKPEDSKKEIICSFFKRFEYKINSLSSSNEEKYSLLSQQIGKHHETYKKAKEIPKIPLIAMQECYKKFDSDNTYYATNEEAQQYRCNVQDIAEWKWSPKEKTLTAIFVVDENFSFYRDIRQAIEKRRLYHSTFLNGVPVKYAGELLYNVHSEKTGLLQLVGITNKSGHYTPHCDTLLGLLLWLHRYPSRFALENMTVQAYGQSSILAIQYLIRESKLFVEKILKFAKSKEFNLSKFVTLMQYLPDVNFSLYSEDKRKRYKPLYPSEILSQYCNKSSAKDLAIFFLSHCKYDSCATQAIRDLGRWLSVTDAPAKNYMFVIHLIRRNLVTTLINSSVLNLQEWLPTLYQYGYNLDWYDDDGMTLLYRACRYNRTDDAKLLLQYKAAVNQRNGLFYSRQYNASNPHPLHGSQYTETTLEAAAINGNLTIVKMLIDAGSDTHFSQPLPKNKGLTLLQIVIKKSSSVELIRMMLYAIKEHELNGTINYYSEEGYTAFHYLFLPNNNLSNGEKKEILSIIKTCPGVDFSLKTNTSPMRSIEDLAKFYDDFQGLNILQELNIISEVDQWLMRNNSSPRENLPLENKNLMPNKDKNSEINDFIQKKQKQYYGEVKQVFFERSSELGSKDISDEITGLVKSYLG